MLNKNTFQEKFQQQESKFAVAFSGGGDSTALLYWLLKNYGASNVHAFHFNHGLRAEACAEQLQLEEFCNKLGVAFTAETWAEKPQGNLQQSARYARYQFLNKMCKKYNFPCVYTGHNQDDIAETVLMRLARGSGLKGLSAMAENTQIKGCKVCRPLLNCSREDIRNYLRNNNIEWLEDSSNENDKFFRVRVRKHKQELEKIGISFESIVASSLSLRRAEKFISQVSDDYYEQHINNDNNILSCSENILQQQDELILRVIDKMISTITGEKMMPRTTKKQRLINHLKTSNKRYELGGVAFYKNKQQIFAKKA